MKGVRWISERCRPIPARLSLRQSADERPAVPHFALPSALSPGSASPRGRSQRQISAGRIEKTCLTDPGVYKPILRGIDLHFVLKSRDGSILVDHQRGPPAIPHRRSRSVPSTTATSCPRRRRANPRPGILKECSVLPWVLPCSPGNPARSTPGNRRWRLRARRLWQWPQSRGRRTPPGWMETEGWQAQSESPPCSPHLTASMPRSSSDRSAQNNASGTREFTLQV